jgi:hypothetical protein
MLLGYINHKGRVVLNPSHVARRYLQSWFWFDVIISIPYLALWESYSERPLHKLLEQRNNKRPILNFIFNRKFRMDTLQALRAHIKERRWVNEMLAINRPMLPIHRRLFKWAGVYIKGRRYVELFATWGAALKTLVGIVTSLRVCSVVSKLCSGILT